MIIYWHGQHDQVSYYVTERTLENDKKSTSKALRRIMSSMNNYMRCQSVILCIVVDLYMEVWSKVMYSRSQNVIL